MQNIKRIFVIADFKDDSPRSFQIQSRMWVKGLLRLGHDVQRFSYRDAMLRSSLIPIKHFALRFAKQKVDSLLIKQIKSYNPDIVLILGMKYLDESTITQIRQVSGKAIIIGRDEDPSPERNPARLKIAQNTDMVIATGAGRFLKAYSDTGVPKCAFIPNMCDPDIQYRYQVDEKWKSDIIFTGKPEHTRLERNNERFTLTQRLKRYPNARLFGFSGSPKIYGLDYLHAISGAKIGVSINIINDVELYHSDRLINYVACGTFTLSKRVPETELLFEDKKHLVYFDTADEFFELAEWYLKHDNEREKIASAGMNHAHKEFNCTKMSGLFMDIIEKGKYDAPWAVIL
jgi:spore maturation protein CgeB